MHRSSLGLAILLGLAGCVPSYAQGDDASVERELLRIVSPGSGTDDLVRAARDHGWQLKANGIYRGDGGPTYFDDHGRPCRSFPNGLVIGAIVAHYFAPLETYVETQWIFDGTDRLRRVCVRRSVDGP